MPEVTRGVLGWWKEPVGTRISLIDQQGGKYTIEWVMKCGNDLLRPNPLGSSTLYAKKCFHTVKLPDGTSNEIEAVQPTGMLRIDRDKNAIEVFVDGEAVIAGTISPVGTTCRIRDRRSQGKERHAVFHGFQDRPLANQVGSALARIAGGQPPAECALIPSHRQLCPENSAIPA